MKLGFIQVYNEANWIGYAIDQAVKLCDKVLIVEGAQYVSFPDIPERSYDGTLDIISDKVCQYPNVLQVSNTIRNHTSYRVNQCRNFNYGLSLCGRGDYFIILDADEFYTDVCIAEMNDIMRENKIETIFIETNFFIFSFKWSMDFGATSSIEIVVKKIDGFYFAPTSKRINAGRRIASIDGFNRFHYMWLKPKARLLTRMQTSMRYPGMVNWFEEAWRDMRLEDGLLYKSYNKDFTLHRYDGEHPSILDDHPWRHIDDIRSLENG